LLIASQTLPGKPLDNHVDRSGEVDFVSATMAFGVS
jgi:hypothetical protein